MSVTFTNDEYEDGFAPFKSEWKGLQITDFGEDENKNSTGRIAWFEFTVLDGDDKGRAFRLFFNYLHSNREAEKIARGQLCSLGQAVGVKEISIPDGMDRFRGKKLRGNVMQKKGDDFPKIKEFAAPQQSGFDFEDLEEANEMTQREPAPSRAATRDPYAR